MITNKISASKEGSSVFSELRSIESKTFAFDFELVVDHRGFNSRSDLAWIIPRGKLFKLLISQLESWLKE